jgi:hypothetical protein
MVHSKLHSMLHSMLHSKLHTRGFWTKSASTILACGASGAAEVEASSVTTLQKTRALLLVGIVAAGA